MSYYLIGIGGTGARCMEAFLHLNGAGLLRDNQDIKLVYVDADVSCGNLVRTQQTAEKFTKAKKIGFGQCTLFKNGITQSDLWTPVEEGADTMETVFDRVVISEKKDTKGLGKLMDVLFTEQERKTNLDKGFRGHPAIGSAVMNQKMDKDQSPWNEILPQINADKDAKVFLFASVFGGTGAAGFPTIAKLLLEYLKKDESGNSVATIGGALVLPYFQFPPADNDEQAEMQAKVDEFMLNTKSALNYYDQNGLLGKVFTSIYMVGDNDLNEVSTFSLGSNSQKNEANIIEMYAALAAFDFFNRTEYEKGTAPMIARGEENNNVITWEDLPNVCASGKMQDKLALYIRFLYLYRSAVLPALEECAADKNAQKKIAWYVKLVEKAGKIDVYDDKETMERFRALGEYAESFFAWMSEIVSSNTRQIELVSGEVTKPDFFNRKLKLDAYQIVLPIQKQKDDLTYNQFWQKLSNYTKQMEKTSASGAEVLMKAIEEIAGR